MRVSLTKFPLDKILLYIKATIIKDDVSTLLSVDIVDLIGIYDNTLEDVLLL